MLYLHQALARGLRERGAVRLFGLIGDANLFMVDSYTREHGGVFTPVRNEANAVLAAIGYARITGRVGFATVTHGPALSNAITALLEAARARVPLILVAGDTDRRDPDNLQNLDQESLVRAAEAAFVDIDDADSWLERLDEAIQTAVRQSGPVVLNVRVDDMWREVGSELTASEAPLVPRHTEVGVSEAQLEEVAAFLASAKRPLILAGRGVINASRSAAVAALAETTGAVLATSIGAKDLFAGHPADVGVFGTLSTERGIAAIQAADTVLALGCSLNNFTTDRGELFQGKRLLAVNTDATRSGSSLFQPETIEADAGALAEQLTALWGEAELPVSGFAASLGPLTVPPQLEARMQSGIDLEVAYRQLDEGLPSERVLVTDGGRFLPLAWKHLHVDHPSKLVPTIHVGAIGHGIGHALGAAVAAPELPVVVVVGDGGLQLGGLQELVTAANLGSTFIVVVVNDGGYGAEYVQFERRGMDASASKIATPDFAAVARGMGGEASTVRTHEDLELAISAAREAQGLYLIDLVVDMAAVPNLLPH